MSVVHLALLRWNISNNLILDYHGLIDNRFVYDYRFDVS